MPLTKSGKRMLKDFERQYGKKKGKSYFYAFIKKFPRLAKMWHKVKQHGL